MDENLAAIAVAAITGLFGIIGIYITQRSAKNRTSDKIKKDEMQSTINATRTVPDIVDSMAVLTHTVKENGLVAREGITNLKAYILDIDGRLRDVQHDVEVIKRELF